MIKTIYFLVNFGKSFLPEAVEAGDPVKHEMVDDVLQEICILSDLDIPNLEDES